MAGTFILPRGGHIMWSHESTSLSTSRGVDSRLDTFEDHQTFTFVPNHECTMVYELSKEQESNDKILRLLTNLLYLTRRFHHFI